jgi:homoaconitase/3-isopropylmalate dehydratase large subunit
MRNYVTDLSIFVRHSTVDDDQVVANHRQLSEQESALYRGSISLASTEPLSRIVLVAGLGSTVMGSLVASQTAENSWTIESVFVESTCRDIGIGDVLVIASLREFRFKNATSVHSHALPGDRATKNLFERHGLVAQMITVGKSL